MGASFATAAPTREVLVLYSNSRLLPANVELDRGLQEVFNTHPEAPVEVSTEFLDVQRSNGEAYWATVATYLSAKYATRVPEVIVVVGPEAFLFALRYRQQTFPGVPVIHQGVSVERLKGLAALPADVVGVGLRLDFPGTVDLALRLHPKARRLLLVTGADDYSKQWEKRLRDELGSLQGRVAVEFMSGLGADALKASLGQLGDDAVVFTPGFFRDGDGRVFVPRDAARFVAGAATAPVYSVYSTFLGSGVVGGVMASHSDMGRIAANAALGVLAGTEAAALAMPPVMPNLAYVDWRQARRWNIDPEAIPGDAIIDFKQPSFWQEYGHLMVIAGAVILLQTALIVSLLIERRRRRRTASALALSEQRMSLAAHAARLSMWSWDLGRAEQRPATPARRSTDQPSGPFTDFKEVLATVHPLDRPAVQHAVERALASGDELDVEYRVHTADGSPHWMAARGRAAQGSRQRLLGVVLDITERRQAELQAEQDRAALRHMTRVSLLGQLSASIAHQLNQPLASILGNAEAAQAMLAADSVDLDELSAICGDIVSEDQRAAAIIRRLGSLFKRGEPTLAPLDVNELLRDTLELLRTSLLTRHVTVAMRLAPGLPLLDGDRVQLQQLLLNLILNAAEAMSGLPAERRSIVVSSALLGSDIRICVADCGPGLSAQDRAKIFEPFWSSKAEGMGIGLAIGRSIAEAHRGCIVASNRPEGGALFCVQLPVSLSTLVTPAPATA